MTRTAIAIWPLFIMLPALGHASPVTCRIAEPGWIYQDQTEAVSRHWNSFTDAELARDADPKDQARIASQRRLKVIANDLGQLFPWVAKVDCPPIVEGAWISAIDLVMSKIPHLEEIDYFTLGKKRLRRLGVNPNQPPTFTANDVAEYLNHPIPVIRDDQFLASASPFYFQSAERAVKHTTTEYLDFYLHGWKPGVSVNSEDIKDTSP